MARRRKKGRDITGVIIIDKPTGHSSNYILQKVKRLFNAKKAGHTGSLDPLATGVLPICLGEATKLSAYLLDSDKRYHVTCHMGVSTDSGDADGKQLNTHPIPDFTESDLQHVLTQFIGEQHQVPPMYSALKHQGQPLYKLARKGIEVTRKARTVTIYDIQLLTMTKESFTLDVRCSKGTYIRTLVEDISHALGSGGHVTMLRRVEAANYTLQDAISLDALQENSEDGDGLDSKLSAAENALSDWPEVILDDEMVQSLRYGQTVNPPPIVGTGLIKVFDEQHVFIGLAELLQDGTLAPKRIFVLPDND